MKVSYSEQKTIGVWAKLFQQRCQNGFHVPRETFQAGIFEKSYKLFGLRAEKCWTLMKRILAGLSELHLTYPKEDFGRKREHVHSKLANHGKKARYWGNDFPFVTYYDGK